MTEKLSAEDFEKAARNLERLAHFLAERRAWILAGDGEAAAASVRNAAASLAALLVESYGEGAAAPAPSPRPKMLEPSSTVSAVRLSKFAAFIDELQEWFAARVGDTPPAGAEQSLAAIFGSLASTERSIDELTGLRRGPETGSQPLVSGDLGPVAQVDMNARLILEDSSEAPLLQVFRGVTELTPEAIEQVEGFLAGQGITLAGGERRRLHEKVLRWIQSTPEGQVLVIKLSGLSGRAEVFSSYRPKPKGGPTGGG